MSSQSSILGTTNARVGRYEINMSPETEVDDFDQHV